MRIERWPNYFSAFSLICVMLVISKTQAQSEERPVRLEVEIQREPEVSRICVYIKNDTDAPFRFSTGGAGGQHNGDDGFRIGDGSTKMIYHGQGATVFPELQFAYGSSDDLASITVRPPSFTAPGQRTMRPVEFEAPMHSRVLYCSFAVPSIHVTGQFGMCTMYVHQSGTAESKDNDRLLSCSKLIETEVAEKPGSENEKGK